MGIGSLIWSGIKSVGGKLFGVAKDALIGGSDNESSGSEKSVDSTEKDLKDKLNDLNSDKDPYSMQESLEEKKTEQARTRELNEIKNKNIREAKKKLEELSKGLDKDDKAKKLMELIVYLDNRKADTITELIKKGNIEKAEKKIHGWLDIGKKKEKKNKDIIKTILKGTLGALVVAGVSALSSLFGKQEGIIGEETKKLTDNTVKVLHDMNDSSKTLTEYINNTYSDPNNKYHETIKTLQDIYGNDKYNKYSFDETIKKFDEINSSENKEKFEDIHNKICKIAGGKSENKFKELISRYLEYYKNHKLIDLYKFNTAYNNLFNYIYNAIENRPHCIKYNEFNELINEYLINNDEFKELNKFLHISEIRIVNTDTDKIYIKDIIIDENKVTPSKIYIEEKYKNIIRNSNNKFLIQIYYEYYILGGTILRNDTKSISAIYCNLKIDDINKDIILILTDYVKDYKLTDSVKTLKLHNQKLNENIEKYTNQVNNLNNNAISSLSTDIKTKLNEFDKFKSSDTYKNINTIEKNIVKDLDNNVSDTTILSIYKQYSNIGKDNRTKELEEIINKTTIYVYNKIFYLIEKLMAGIYAIPRKFYSNKNITDIDKYKDDIESFIKKYYGYKSIDKLLELEDIIENLSNEDINNKYIKNINNPNEFIKDKYFKDIDDIIQFDSMDDFYIYGRHLFGDASFIHDIRYNITGIRTLYYYNIHSMAEFSNASDDVKMNLIYKFLLRNDIDNYYLELLTSKYPDDFTEYKEILDNKSEQLEINEKLGIYYNSNHKPVITEEENGSNSTTTTHKKSKLFQDIIIGSNKQHVTKSNNSTNITNTANSEYKILTDNDNDNNIQEEEEKKEDYTPAETNINNGTTTQLDSTTKEQLSSNDVISVDDNGNIVIKDKDNHTSTTAVLIKTKDFNRLESKVDDLCINSAGTRNDIVETYGQVVSVRSDLAKPNDSTLPIDINNC
jgi:hypothetical protein